MDRGLRQEHVAQELGVLVSTICNWEMNHTRVATRFLPKVVPSLATTLGRRPGSWVTGFGHFGSGRASRRRRWPRSSASISRRSRSGAGPGTQALSHGGERRFEEFLAGGGRRLSVPLNAKPPRRVALLSLLQRDRSQSGKGATQSWENPRRTPALPLLGGVFPLLPGSQGVERSSPRRSPATGKTQRRLPLRGFQRPE